MILTGALVNGLAIVAAGVLGTLGGRLMLEKMKQTVLAATALVSIGIGDAVITEITVTGSLLIIGIGLNVLGLTKLRILNMTPALLIPILLCQFM